MSLNMNTQVTSSQVDRVPLGKPTKLQTESPDVSITTSSGIPYGRTFGAKGFSRNIRIFNAVRILILIGAFRFGSAAQKHDRNNSIFWKTWSSKNIPSKEALDFMKTKQAEWPILRQKYFRRVNRRNPDEGVRPVPSFIATADQRNKIQIGVGTKISKINVLNHVYTIDNGFPHGQVKSLDNEHKGICRVQFTTEGKLGHKKVKEYDCVYHRSRSTKLIYFHKIYKKSRYQKSMDSTVRSPGKKRKRRSGSRSHKPQQPTAPKSERGSPEKDPIKERRAKPSPLSYTSMARGATWYGPINATIMKKDLRIFNTFGTHVGKVSDFDEHKKTCHIMLKAQEGITEAEDTAQIECQAKYGFHKCSTGNRFLFEKLDLKQGVSKSHEL